MYQLETINSFLFYLRVVEAFSLRMLNSDVRALSRVFLLDA